MDNSQHNDGIPEDPLIDELSPAQQTGCAALFLSPQDGRLRIGWRMALAITAYLLLQGVLFAVISISIMFTWFQDEGALFIFVFLSTLMTTGLVFVLRRNLDHRSIISLGLHVNRQAGYDILFGFLLGGLLMAGIFLVYRTAGWLVIVEYGWQMQPPAMLVLSLVLLLLAVGLFTGWSEELLLRGYVLQNLAENGKLFRAIVISSLIFSIFHLGNPESSWRSFLGITIAGMFLACGWVFTRQLWLPIGLHAGWNFFQAFFGFSVSGVAGLPSLVTINIVGPELFTGGVFGPEAGLVSLVAMFLGTGAIYYWSRWTRHPANF